MSTGAGPSGVRIWVTCLLNGLGVVRGVVSDHGLTGRSFRHWAAIQDRETCRILPFELLIEFEILSVKILFGINDLLILNS